MFVSHSKLTAKVKLIYMLRVSAFGGCLEGEEGRGGEGRHDVMVTMGFDPKQNDYKKHGQKVANKMKQLPNNNMNQQPNNMRINNMNNNNNNNDNDNNNNNNHHDNHHDNDNNNNSNNNNNNKRATDHDLTGNDWDGKCSGNRHIGHFFGTQTTLDYLKRETFNINPSKLVNDDFKLKKFIQNKNGLEIVEM